MSDNDFIFAVARIRVKEKSLLSDADVAQMTALKDEKAVLAYLKDKGCRTQPDAAAAVFQDHGRKNHKRNQADAET